MIALLLAALGFSGRAFGADTREEARKRYQQGATAFEKGDFAAAVDAFDEVYKVTGETKHLWNLAIAEYKAGHSYAALVRFREYVAKPDANAKNAENAELLIAEEAHKVAHLSVTAPEGADLFIDGERVGVAPLAAPIDVDPDRPHVVAASRGPDEAKQSLAAPGPKTVPVALSFPVSPPVPSAPATVAPTVAFVPAAGRPASASETTAASRASGFALRTWMTVGLGVGAVAVGGVGVLFGVDSTNARNSATALRGGMTPGLCRNPSAPGCPTLQSDLASQENDHVASMVLYGVAGALAAGAVASWLFIPHDKTEAAPGSAPPNGITPVFGANLVGATYGRSF
jgi:hypothetical protein